MADIKIDGKLFQERVSHFVSSWKNDLRSKEALFGGASSLVVMMGKVEEAPELHKNNAMHVRCAPLSLLICPENFLLSRRSADLLPSSGFSDTNSRPL